MCRQSSFEFMRQHVITSKPPSSSSFFSSSSSTSSTVARVGLVSLLHQCGAVAFKRRYTNEFNVKVMSHTYYRISRLKFTYSYFNHLTWKHPSPYGWCVYVCVLCARARARVHLPVYTIHLNSDAGYAVLPLTLLGAPVSIGRALGGRDRDRDSGSEIFQNSQLGMCVSMCVCMC